MTLFELAWTFFYIGLFTIGGGQVAITLMYEPFVGGGVISGEEFYNMLAISESTPGPIGINMATYIGCKMYGVAGGLVTTFATVLPSLVVIMIVAKYFESYQNKAIVKSVFSCIRPASAGLIAVAFWQVFCIGVLFLDKGTSLNKDFFANLQILPIVWYVFASICYIRIKKLSPIVVIVASAIFGMLFL